MSELTFFVGPEHHTHHHLEDGPIIVRSWRAGAQIAGRPKTYLLYTSLFDTKKDARDFLDALQTSCLETLLRQDGWETWKDERPSLEQRWDEEARRERLARP